MRNLKKILSVLIVVAMLVASMVPAFAATTFTYESQAKALYDIGLFKGTSATEFVPDLGSALTREQGIALVVRLLGKDAEATKLTDAEAAEILAGYADVKSVEPSLLKYVAYAVKNKMVVGDGKNLDPKGALTGNALATMILRNLGYTVDAKGYDTAAATLVEKGGLSTAEATKFATKELTRDDLVGICYAALQAKDSTGKKVIENLIASKAVDETKAIAAGVYSKAAAASSMTAKITGRTTIAVTFDGAVDTTKAAIAVKKGTNAVTTTTKFADDKKSATLTATSKFTEGDYTVTVTGVAAKDLTATITAEDEKVSKISFTSDKAVIVPEEDEDYENMEVYAYFKILNQYNEDITDSYTSLPGEFTWSSVVTNDYLNFDYAKEGKLIIPVAKDLDSTDDEFTYGESVPVSVVYNDDGYVVTASTVLTVGTKAGVGELKVTKLYNDTGKALTVSSTFSSYYLLLELKDQYGNALDFDSDEYLIKEDLTVSSGNPSILKFEEDADDYYAFQKLVIDNKDYIALPLTAAENPVSGTCTVTIISKTTGKMVQYAVEVGDGTYAASFTMTKPDVAVLSEKTVVAFTATDKEGVAVTDIDDLKQANDDDEYYVDLDVSGADDDCFYFEENASTGLAQLVFNASKDSTLEEDDVVTLTTTTHPGYKTSTVSFKMKSAKVPDTIDGISSTYVKKIAQGSFMPLAYDQIIVKDNYSRTIPAKELKWQLASEIGIDAAGATTCTADGQYRVAVSSSSANVQVVGAYGDNKGTTSTTDDVYYIGKNIEKVFFYAANEGTATITVKMQQYVDSAWKDIADADYQFTLTTIDRDDVKAITVGAIADSYDRGWYSANNTNLRNDRSYSNTFGVTGTLSDGSSVYISQQMLPTLDKGLVNAYSVNTGYSNKITVGADSSVAGFTYNAAYNNKFTVNDKVNDDEDETTTIPFTVTPNTAYFDGVKSVTSSFKLLSADPVLSTIALAYNGFVQLSADGGSVEISEADLATLKASTFVNSSASNLILKLVSDAVVAKDQYGKEHDNEYLAANNVYKIVTPDDFSFSTLSASGDSVEVTVITYSGALTKTFKITVK